MMVTFIMMMISVRSRASVLGTAAVVGSGVGEWLVGWEMRGGGGGGSGGWVYVYMCICVVMEWLYVMMDVVMDVAGCGCVCGFG